MRIAGWLGGATVAAAIAALTTPAMFLAIASSDASATLTTHAGAVVSHVLLTSPHAITDGPPWGP